MADHESSYDRAVKVTREVQRGNRTYSPQDVSASIASNGQYKPTQQQPKRFNPTNQANERLNQAKQEVKRSDPPNYKGEPVREYRKQLIARAESIGSREAFGSKEKMMRTDQEISTRMSISGYTDKEIGAALQKASPYTATLKNPRRQESYARNMSALGARDANTIDQSKGIKRDLAEYKIANGMSPNDRRTDKLKTMQQPEGKIHKIDSIKNARIQEKNRVTQAALQSQKQTNRIKR